MKEKEQDPFQPERINELLYRFKCDESLEKRIEAYDELRSMGLLPDKIADLVSDIECQELIDSLNDDLLGC